MATNSGDFLRYPPIPKPPANVDKEVLAWYNSLEMWYYDFTRLLQSDRQTILLKIDKLS